jgi:hypothetical protein
MSHFSIIHHPSSLATSATSATSAASAASADQRTMIVMEEIDKDGWTTFSSDSTWQSSKWIGNQSGVP